MGDKVLIPTSKDQAISGVLRVCKTAAKTKRLTSLAVMIHDYPGNKSSNNDLFGDLEFTLAEIGLSSLRIDLYGCGETGGNEKAFSLTGGSQDIKHVRSWAQKQGFKHLVFIGSGLGASLSILNIESDVSAMVLFWPVIDLKDYIEKIKADAGPQLLADVQKINMKSKINNIHMPFLVMHGARDKVVPVKTSELFKTQTNSKNPEITIFHDGEYGLPQLNHRKALFFQVEQFLAKYT